MVKINSLMSVSERCVSKSSTDGSIAIKVENNDEITVKFEENIIQVHKENDVNKDVPSDFEDAINATGFGKFNILLILCCFPAYCTSVYVSSSLSYILSVAECDLNMSMSDMGRLNIFTYAGMVCSAVMWGFLSDTLGRKRIIIGGFLLLSVMELIASQSISYFMLSFAKFCAGFILNGPFAVFLSYVSEMHKYSIRALVMVYLGMFFPFATTTLPLLAWAVIPRNISVTLFGGLYELHSWQVFLSMFCIPPLATGLAVMLLPESPKFLMSRGRNEEALRVFQKMFAMNTGRPENEYSIKKLVEERGNSSKAPSGWKAIQGGFQQLKPLFMPPHLTNLVVVCFIMLSLMYGGNTLRLWFPQISTIVEDYNSKHTETSSFCYILDTYVSNKANESSMTNVVHECIKINPGPETFINSIIISSSGFISYLGAGLLVKLIGKRTLASLGILLTGLCAGALYWSSSFHQIVALFAIFCSVNCVTGTLMSSIAVMLFPTSVRYYRSWKKCKLLDPIYRAMAVAVLYMCGRLGTVLGGLTFSHLLAQGCHVPFILISAILIVAGLLCFVLPGTSKNTGKS